MRSLTILLIGVLINSVGTGMTAFGLGVFAYQLQGTATAVALVQLCAFAPIILLAPLAGALADRFDRRLMMAIGDGGSVLGLGVVLAALSSPSPRLEVILAGVTASSCLAALTEPALRASITDLVPAEDHVRSAGLLQAATAARYLVSPFLAGALLPLVGLRALLVMDAATCLVTVTCSVVVMRTLRAAIASGSAAAAGSAEARASAPAEPEGAAGHLLGGWRAVLHHPGLRTIVGLMTVMTLAIGTVQVLLKPILLPHVDAAAMGRVETLAATGILAGAALVTLLSRARPTTLLSAGTAATGAAMVLLSLRSWTWWVALSGFAVFAALSLCQAGAETLVRRSVAADHQARVWGVISLVTQLGYLAAYLSVGALSDAVLEPLLRPTGALAPSIGALLGTGQGRGAALMVALAGLGTIVLALLIHLRRGTLAPAAATQTSPGPLPGAHHHGETRSGHAPRRIRPAERPIPQEAPSW
ncbi:MFS transporter [Actinomyces bowdenii]|uniref:MFS transporter n=1 Tax=Actinomyces bowdenii TaxID=131109 RepID=A0A853EJE3_9ACTO|nr:MFS transporter [Actinomyces bowdenii]MBF0696159.1 MFS transporter [Actinomyces bowdenii]NYS68332.1 MFS transporter [Actinomyces bowdenii]